MLACDQPIWHPKTLESHVAMLGSVLAPRWVSLFWVTSPNCFKHSAWLARVLSNGSVLPGLAVSRNFQLSLFQAGIFTIKFFLSERISFPACQKRKLQRSILTLARYPGCVSRHQSETSERWKQGGGNSSQDDKDGSFEMNQPLALHREARNSTLPYGGMASAPNKGRATRNKENVSRSQQRPLQQSKQSKALSEAPPTRSLFAEHQNSVKSRGWEAARRKPERVLGLTDRGFPPPRYNPSHRVSSSHSEGSSDTSSIFENFSFEGDDLLQEIPSVIHRESPRLSNASTRSNFSGDSYSNHALTQSTSSLHYGSIQQHRNLGTNESVRVSLPSAHNIAGSVSSLRTSAAFTLEQKVSDCSRSLSYLERLSAYLDPSDWLSSGLQFEEDGTPYFDDDLRWSLAGLLRTLLYNPVYPEFSSLQQFSWAVLIGVLMGVYTAVWKLLIETCVQFMWKDVPERLLHFGVFSELDGWFPIYHYMWICPCIMGGILSYISAALDNPIPGQNEWIHNLHSRGIQNYDTFLHIIALSTAGMASGMAMQICLHLLSAICLQTSPHSQLLLGLSLGPELPLILTSGMIGSRLAVLCKQSMLQARVLNLTAASAAIGGFFGFPMAGALFVLEVPHRMGLQYFEALSPATIASIVAVLTNRLVTGNDVTGYYEYPFLSESLPSEIFTSAIIFGLFGGGIGILYAKIVLDLKHRVHEIFRGRDKEHANDLAQSECDPRVSERLPLIYSTAETQKPVKTRGNCTSRANRFGPFKAAASGSLAGLLVGVTCVFIPHVMFWGEAQLQTLIDKGRTPLPVFGRGDEPSAGLVALSYCIATNADSGSDRSGSEFNLGCSAGWLLLHIRASTLV